VSDDPNDRLHRPGGHKPPKVVVLHNPGSDGWVLSMLRRKRELVKRMLDK
jgi:hypothetical protein